MKNLHKIEIPERQPENLFKRLFSNNQYDLSSYLPRYGKTWTYTPYNDETTAYYDFPIAEYWGNGTVETPTIQTTIATCAVCGTTIDGELKFVIAG